MHNNEDNEQINEDEIPTSNATQQGKNDVGTDKGDETILRIIGRSAAVNLAVTATAALPLSGVAYLAEGAIAAKRLGDGVENGSKTEVAKSLAVFGSSTSASLVGQAATGALMVGVVGASLPVAGAVAFTVGCVSGITAAVFSEWGVDRVMKTEGEGKEISNEEVKDSSENEKDIMNVASTLEIRCGEQTGITCTSGRDESIMRRDIEVEKEDMNKDGEVIVEEEEEKKKKKKEEIKGGKKTNYLQLLVKKWNVDRKTK